jgi:hypothetical protein
LNQSLAVDDPSGVEVGNTGNLDSLLGGVEVNDFLGVCLESYSCVSWHGIRNSDPRWLT